MILLTCSAAQVIHSLYRSSNSLIVALAEFKESLSPGQIQDYNAACGSSRTHEDVFSFTAEIQNKNSARMSRVVANRIRPVLESIQQYCAIVDTFIQAKPEVAALAWGTVKFLILVYPHI